MPGQGVFRTGLFYFNIFGSNNQKDVKLVAFLWVGNSGPRITYLNDEINEWKYIPSKLSNKWNFPIEDRITSFGITYWVPIFCFIFFYFLYFLIFFFMFVKSTQKKNFFFKVQSN